MKLRFKMNWSLRRAALFGLERTHKFAFERIGFFFCRAAAISDGLLIIAESYKDVRDENYVQDLAVGARINGDAFRDAFQVSLNTGVGLFHVHMHQHAGTPYPSQTDLVESRKYVPDFFNLTPSMPHGTVILSKDSAFGLCWLGKHCEPKPIDRFEFVGSPFKIVDIRQ